jgi:peptide/nickel transport system substrate-binding protein
VTRGSISFALIGFSLLAQACGQRPAAPGQAGGEAGAREIGPTTPTRVIIGVRSDVSNLSSKLATDNTSTTTSGNQRFLSNSPLVVFDAQGNAQPRLAVELPSQTSGTWTVAPDGTMATTWRIRPEAVWHDGTPITVRDFQFALQVYQDPDVLVEDRDPERKMDRIEAVDDKTFTLHWKQLYAEASRLISGQLEPLPAHLLLSPYETGEKQAFANLPFFTSPDYIGSGPYRVVTWEKGVQQAFRAFDRYFLGRPKIDEVVFQFLTDSNVVVANVLTGAVDLTTGFVLAQQAVPVLREKWDASGDGQIFVTATHTRYAQIQQDPAKRGNPALLDVRVRRAIAHALDREAIASVVTSGAAPATEIPVAPNDPLYARAQQVIAKYPFDRTRAMALLQEAGWTKRSDTLVNASGEPFTLELRTSSSASDNVTQNDLIAADLTALGMQTSEVGVPTTNRDNEYRASFPGLWTAATPIDVPGSLTRFTSDQCPRLSDRFSLPNLGCWSNREYDGFVQVVTTSLDERAREDAELQALRVLTQDVGIFAMSYNTENIPVRRGLVGPGTRWPAQTGTTWNVHEWEWK